MIFVAELIFCQTVVIGRLVNNRTDERLCEQIAEMIENYEDGSGEQIKQICIYYDSAITKRNPGVLKIGDSNVRAFSKTWSDVEHMNVILGRDFAECAQNPEYAAYFASQNWDAFSGDQLIFDGETLHLCVY